MSLQTHIIGYTEPSPLSVDNQVRFVDLLSVEYRPQSPSRRRPHSNWYFNQTDVTERQMPADSHRTWGLVIYTMTYSSGDDEWTEFLRRPHGGHFRLLQRPGYPGTLRIDRLLELIAFRRRQHAHHPRASLAVGRERISRGAAATTWFRR